MKRLGLLGVLAIALAACGGDDAENAAERPLTDPAPGATDTGATETDAPTQAQSTFVVYFLRDEKVAPVRRTVRETPQLATAAVRSLFAGPNEDGFASAVPDGTRLHGVVIEGGTATVDVSGEFGSGGGSLSMQARLAQLVYTLTQFPTVKDVVLEIDGEDIDTLGGEGIDTSRPLTRADFEDVTPGILVEFPLPGDRVEIPFTARGTSNTYEATHQLQVVAADNGAGPLFETFVTATSGTGERGTWEQEVDFDLEGAGPRELTLRVFEGSAEDGSETKVVEIPIRAGG